MSRIETEIWESNPNKPGYVRYVGQRMISKVFDELTDFLAEHKLTPDEYFLLNHDLDKDSKLPKVLDVRCYAQWGGSEGIYLEVDFLVQNEDNTRRWTSFATGKTLGETSKDFNRMQYIAGRIYKAFTTEGSMHSEEVSHE